MSTLVQDRMSHPPVVIRPEATVPEAAQLMRQHGFRRLPVVQDNRLVGIVTDRDLKEAMPSDATSLSIWEISYLLGQLKVSEVMCRSVITAAADMPLTDAAHMMLERKIGGLPVINERHDLVGVLTVSDILRDYIAARPTAPA